MAGPLPEGRLIEHVGAIYDCVIDPAGWEPLVATLRRELDFANSLLVVNTLPSGRAVVHVGDGVPAEWLQRVPEYNDDILDLWGGLGRVLSLPTREPLILSEVTDRTRWLDTNRYYREWAAPQGLIDAVTIGLVQDPTMTATLTFGRHQSQGEIGDEVETLRVLAPHFARAVVISGLLDREATKAATFEIALGAASAGIVLVDDRQRIVYANPVAGAMLSAGDPIEDRGGRLGLREEAVAAQVFDRAIAAAIEAGPGPSGPVGVPGRWRDGRPCIAHVMPLRRQTVRPGSLPRGAAAVFVAAAVGPQLPGDAIALLFDLTPAELGVMELVVAGERDIARALGIASSTVKTHLLHVFEKTGCHRKADLVKLAAAMTPPL